MKSQNLLIATCMGLGMLVGAYMMFTYALIKAGDVNKSTIEAASTASGLVMCSMVDQEHLSEYGKKVCSNIKSMKNSQKSVE